jgi:hypothetical protein
MKVLDTAMLTLYNLSSRFCACNKKARFKNDGLPEPNIWSLSSN